MTYKMTEYAHKKSVNLKHLTMIHNENKS